MNSQFPSHSKKTLRIIVSGIGGIGGYYGGLLAHYASLHPEEQIEVDFLMRTGAHLDTVRKQGLHVVCPHGDIYAHPHCASDTPTDFAPAQYIILATKSYHLAQNIEQLRPLLQPGTVVLPLLNGLDVHDELNRLLPPEVIRWVGCVFITARRSEPGLIRSNSPQERLFMGCPERSCPTSRMEEELLLQQVMIAAGIDAVVSDHPMDDVRKKYLMLSNSAAATAYLNTNVDGLVGEHRPFVEGLTREIVNLYRAKGWPVEEDAVEASLRRIERMPSGTTTSMHSDILQGHVSEVESLVGYVVRQSRVMGLEAPYYTEAYQGILERINRK